VYLGESVIRIVKPQAPNVKAAVSASDAN
jgi:hypothetical protein